MHCKKILKFLNNKLATSSKLFVLLLPFRDNKNLRKKAEIIKIIVVKNFISVA
ncbi:hypothetical protein BBUWI9123_E0011 (plasmid) [Borreliella burgdorferi WI91-23]|nr:hypothetical protein BBUWI9123_E0011 [Borreliella burgdorferi WI91-23]